MMFEKNKKTKHSNNGTAAPLSLQMFSCVKRFSVSQRVFFLSLKLGYRQRNASPRFVFHPL